ncbi:glutamic acid-rich protein-like [Papaver somniferum]|uniref:glutamic acid-rich protein-like n=1 Tax=Papaver somniferum TaxID=3469 RepID=UPI000E703609|nr:glutamic acid-rich protein-like [Papaver somniferum]
MVTSSSSNYDYSYSSSSSEEDSWIPVAKTRAKTNRVEESKPSEPLNNHIVTYAELMNRKVEDDRMDDHRRRRDRVQRRMLSAEEKLRSRDDGVPYDSDASEDELVWVPLDLKIKSDRRTREIEKLVKPYLEVEREKEEYWEMMDDDHDIHPDFVNGPDSDSGEEFEEDSEKDDDDESDNSGKSDDSDESDE